MENKIIEDLMPTPLFSRFLYGLLLMLSFIMIFYTYGKYDISLARSFKENCHYAEDKIKMVFYKLWLSTKMKGDAIKINYNDYNVLDNSFDI